jgi:hypothetical protein
MKKEQVLHKREYYREPETNIVRKKDAPLWYELEGW